MLRAITLIASLCAIAHPALAQSCEESFQKSGNVLTGTRYSASVRVQGLPVDSAIAQMRAITASKGMTVITEDAANGSLLVEQPETVAHSALPFTITARSDGDATRVDGLLKTKQGALAKADSIRTEMCSMLAQLKPGRPKVAAPAPAKPTGMLATTLASQVARESKSNRAATAQRYAGRSFRLKGWVSNVYGEKGKYGVYFKTTGQHMLSDGITLGDTSVLCLLAPDQAAYALSLSEGDRLELTGTFRSYELMNITLDNCRPN